MPRYKGGSVPRPVASAFYDEDTRDWRSNCSECGPYLATTDPTLDAALERARQHIATAHPPD